MNAKRQLISGIPYIENMYKKEEKNRQVEELEKNFTDNNTGNAYSYIKKLKGGFKTHTTLVRDKNGTIIKNTTEIKQTWKEFPRTLREQHRNFTSISKKISLMNL